MTLKISKNWDEVVYPFILDQGPLCDYEASTDELCARLGQCHQLVSQNHSSSVDIMADLNYLQELSYHLNGSIRGKLAVAEQDRALLLARLDHYRNIVPDRLSKFTLPRGAIGVAELNLAKCQIKKTLRIIVSMDNAGIVIPEIVIATLNIIGNILFTMGLVLNYRTDIDEALFESKSYRI